MKQLEPFPKKSTQKHPWKLVNWKLMVPFPVKVTRNHPRCKGTIDKKYFPSFIFLGGYSYNVLFREGVDDQIFEPFILCCPTQNHWGQTHLIKHSAEPITQLDDFPAMTLGSPNRNFLSSRPCSRKSLAVSQRMFWHGEMLTAKGHLLSE